MRLISISFQDCAEKVAPVTSSFILPPNQLIDRAVTVCQLKGHFDAQFVRIDYWNDVVEFMVN